MPCNCLGVIAVILALFLSVGPLCYSSLRFFACESGGIGRRARLRIWFRKEWGFESPLSHHLKIRETAVLSWSSKFRREVVLVATVVLLEFHLTPLEVAPIPARRKWMVSKTDTRQSSRAALITLLVHLLLGSSMARAQGTSGEILGTVRDSTG